MKREPPNGATGYLGELIISGSIKIESEILELMIVGLIKVELSIIRLPGMIPVL